MGCRLRASPFVIFNNLRFLGKLVERLSVAIRSAQNRAIFAEQCSFKVGSTGGPAEAAAGKALLGVCDYEDAMRLQSTCGTQ